MSGVWRTDALYYHLVVRGCPQMVQGTKGTIDIPLLFATYEELADNFFLQVNIEHQMLGREGNMVEGKEANDSGDSSSGSLRDPIDEKKTADLA